jgi:NAD(P)-dependent dehydrogenase (short-subunit alcohol dehydrogenase family)
MRKLDGKTAIVTGGSSGIGLATARELIVEGARVIITGRRRSAIDAALEVLGENSVGVQGDLGDLADIDRLVTEAKRTFGTIDILFANAGVNEPGPFETITEASFDRVFETNVKGVFFSVQKLLPILNDGATIILTGSIASQHASDGYAVYAGTKAAIRAFARNWALELKNRSIRVNVLSPGPTRTPMVDGLGLNPQQRVELDDAIAGMIPLGRWGEPEDVAKAALFLASQDSGFITGTELCVDGGLGQI